MVYYRCQRRFVYISFAYNCLACLAFVTNLKPLITNGTLKNNKKEVNLMQAENRRGKNRKQKIRIDLELYIFKWPLVDKYT